jgi:hypothetical protein
MEAGEKLTAVKVEGPGEITPVNGAIERGDIAPEFPRIDADDVVAISDEDGGPELSSQDMEALAERCSGVLVVEVRP